MVQQGNTAALHNLKEISITKGSRGFGFHFASRPSERGNIFLVTHVIPDSASDELLLSGDRLLKIGETDLADLIQSDVRELLKACSIGETLTFQISRTEDAEETIEQSHTSIQSTSDEISGLEADDQILEFRIPVNEAAAAGLGLALKGKQTIGRDGQQNAAVFIDRILRGSAAYKDGRLLEHDRILGIENLNLLQFAQNSEAAQAFNSYVSSLPPSCAYFKIFIARKPENVADQSSIMSRKAFIAWMADIKTDSARLAETIKTANEEQLGLVEGRRKSTTTSQDEETSKLDKREVAEDAISIASVQQVDPFNRESASRKSFSEKGPFGKRDHTKFENFKQISHQRQISAPIIGHRRHRAQLIRQRSAVILKNNTNENRQEEQKTEAPTNNTDPSKQKGFSFLSFFGLRNSISKGSSANKENVQVDENAQNSKRRSMSEGPDKGENRLRTSASHHEEISPAADLSSPSNAAAREALRKKRRSVGTSMFKFFQRTDSPSKLSPNENDISQTEQQRKFAWSPTSQRIDIADPKHSGTSPSKQSGPGSRRRMQTSSHSFKQQRPSVAPIVAGSSEYHNAFNHWFKTVQNPRYDDSPSRYMSADNSVPFYPAPPAYSSIQPSATPNFEQRYTAAYPNFWPQPFCSVQYSPPYSTQAPASAYSQSLYFGRMPQAAAYPIDFNYHEPQRRLSTRSAPKFSTNQPFDVHVERF
ncbi:hypothetical protein M3Y97_00823500 [Aphelenchoides bicaudatus]|nr:hypothetical protein M3Y97_00823500 [Aphelenchoides bicaudatus]